MKLNLEVFTSFKDECKPTRKKLLSFIGKYKHEILIVDQENHVKIINILNGKQAKIPKILDQYVNNIYIANINQSDENVVILLKTGEIIIWNRERDVIHSISEVNSNVLKNIVTSIYISSGFKFVSLVNNSNELFLWVNDNPNYFPTKNAKFNGKWIKVEFSHPFPIDASLELSSDAIFISDYIWGELCLYSCVLISRNHVHICSVKIDLKSLNTEWITYQIDEFGEFFDESTAVCKFSKTEPVLVVGVNSKLIFVNPLTGSKYSLDFPENCRFLLDFCWSNDDAMLICVFDDGKISITTRLGTWTEINKSRDEIYTARFFPKTENSLKRSNFQVLSHCDLPIFIFCDSCSFTGLKIIPEISRAIDLVELTLKNQPKVKKRMKMKKKITFKFKSKEHETFFDKNDEEISTFFQLLPLITNLNLCDLISCFGLLNWNFQTWDEKMEILAQNTTWKLIENFQAIPIGRNFNIAIEIIEDNLLKCLNILQFDVNHRLLASSMKLVIGVIDYLISIKDEIPGSQRINFINRLTNLLRKSQSVIDNSYLIVEKIFCKDLEESQIYFNYRLKRKWTDLYKITSDLFFRYPNQEIENYAEDGKSTGNWLKKGKEFENEENLKLVEAISLIEIELQTLNHRFKKRRKFHLDPGIRRYLSGNRDSGILKWVNEINNSLQVPLILDNSTIKPKKLSKTLRTFLYALAELKNYSTLEFFCRKLLDTSSLSPRLQKEISSFILTLSRFSALTLLGKSNYHPSPHKPCSLASLLTYNPDGAFSDEKNERLLNCESIVLILVTTGHLNEATWFSYAVGDWKLAFLLSYVCGIIDMSLEAGKTKHALINLPNHLSVDELIKNRVIGFLKIDSNMMISNERLVACLNDHMTAAILCDLKFDLGEFAFDYVIEELLKLINQFSLLIDEGFYLPAPPIFCQQDEIVGSSEAARTESQIRFDLFNLIDRLICLLISNSTLVPLSFKYANQFNDSSLRSEFSRYEFENLKNSQTNFTTGSVTNFSTFCNLVWILHCRDQLNISWRTLWKNIDSTRKIEKFLIPCLMWAKNLVDMKNMTKCWEEELNLIILTLVHEANANKRIIDLFIECFPPGWIFPQELDFKWKLVSDYWKRTKDGNSDLYNYYTEKMKNRENEENIDQRETQAQIDFLVIFFDIVVHKKVESHKETERRIPVIKSNMNLIEKQELESVKNLDEKLNCEHISTKIEFLPRWKTESANEISWLHSRKRKGKSLLESYEKAKSIDNNEIEWKFQNRKTFKVDSGLIPILMWLDKWRERNNFENQGKRGQMKINFKIENLISTLSILTEKGTQLVEEVTNIEVQNIPPDEEILEAVDDDETQSEIIISQPKPEKQEESTVKTPKEVEKHVEFEQHEEIPENLENFDFNLHDDTISSVSSLETERTPTPSLIIPKFLRLSAEKETDHPKHFPLEPQPKTSDDPRLRGGGPRPLPLLHIPRETIPVQRNIPTFHNAPPHIGLPLLRLPQKFLQWQRPRVDPCHVCVEDKICPPNVYVQNLLKNYWNHVKEARCQQMVSDSLAVDRDQITVWDHFRNGLENDRNEVVETTKQSPPTRSSKHVSKIEKWLRKHENRVSRKKSPPSRHPEKHTPHARKIVHRCSSPVSGSSSPSPQLQRRSPSPPLKTHTEKSSYGTVPVTRATSPLSRNSLLKLLTEKPKSRTENKVPVVSRCTSPLYKNSSPISRSPSPVSRSPSPVSRRCASPLRSKPLDYRRENLENGGKSGSNIRSPHYGSMKPVSRTPSPPRSPVTRKYNQFFESLQVVPKCPDSDPGTKNQAFGSEQLLTRSRNPSPLSRKISPNKTRTKNEKFGYESEKQVASRSSPSSKIRDKTSSTLKKTWFGVSAKERKTLTHKCTSTYTSDSTAHHFPSSIGNTEADLNHGLVARCVDDDDFRNEDLGYPTVYDMDSNRLTDASMSHFSIVSQLDRVKSILKNLDTVKECKEVQTTDSKFPLQTQSEIETENGFNDFSTVGQDILEDEIYGKKFRDWGTKCNSVRRRQIPSLPPSVPDATALKVKSCFSGKSALPPELYRTREDLSNIFLYGKVPTKSGQKKWKADENCLKNLETCQQPRFGELERVGKVKNCENKENGKVKNCENKENVDKVVECTSFRSLSSSLRSLDGSMETFSRSGILRKFSENMPEIPENVLSEGEEEAGEESGKIIIGRCRDRETSGADKLPRTFLDFQINSKNAGENFRQSPTRNWRENILPVTRQVLSPLSSPKLPARKLATNQLKSKLENFSSQLGIMETISSQLEKGFKTSQQKLFSLVENDVAVTSSPELSSAKKLESFSPDLSEDLKSQRKSSPSFNSHSEKMQTERDLVKNVNFKKRMSQACELMTELMLSQNVNAISTESQQKFKPQVLNILTETRENLKKELNYLETTSEESTPKLQIVEEPGPGMIKMSLGKEIKVDSTILEGSEDNSTQVTTRVAKPVAKRQNIVKNVPGKKRLKVKMTRAAKLRRELANSKLGKSKPKINKLQKIAPSQMDSPKSKNSTPSGLSDWEIPSEIYNILY